MATKRMIDEIDLLKRGIEADIDEMLYGIQNDEYLCNAIMNSIIGDIIDFNKHYDKLYCKRALHESLKSYEMCKNIESKLRMKIKHFERHVARRVVENTIFALDRNYQSWVDTQAIKEKLNDLLTEVYQEDKDPNALKTLALQLFFDEMLKQNGAVPSKTI